MFLGKAIQHHRDVIPLYFDGENSPFFYNFAKLRTRLGLKFNIEMIYLPREMFRRSNSTFSISIGLPIPWESLSNTQEKANEIKQIVYNLKH